MKSFTVVAILILGCSTAISQVAAPRPERFLHHTFGPHHDEDQLPQRIVDLKCALVLIQSGPRQGTGFFVSADGDMATAAHVLGDKQFNINASGQVTVSLAATPAFSIIDSNEKRSEISADKIENNPDGWLSDVALIKTGVAPPCWLRHADDRDTQPGQHVIALGFPGLSFQALTAYVGIISARLPNSGFPAAFVKVGPNPQDTRAVQAPNEVIRVQMPISPGLSGAPLIDDQNRVLGVISAAGGWTQDLDLLLMLMRSGTLSTMIPQPPPPPNSPPNSVQINLNDLMLTAELAGLFHDYASPGYGDAVPLRYLRKQEPQNLQPASRTH